MIVHLCTLSVVCVYGMWQCSIIISFCSISFLWKGWIVLWTVRCIRSILCLLAEQTRNNSTETKWPCGMTLGVCWVGCTYIGRIHYFCLSQATRDVQLVRSSYCTLSMAYCVYCTRPEGKCNKVRNTPLKACSKWFTKNSRPENAHVVWIVECVGCGLQTCSCA